jgi:hypothetical protein
MDEKAKKGYVGEETPDSATKMRYLKSSRRWNDCYGGGAFSVERHTVESLGGYKGFNRDLPTGRMARRKES